MSDKPTARDGSEQNEPTNHGLDVVREHREQFEALADSGLNCSWAAIQLLNAADAEDGR